MQKYIRVSEVTQYPYELGTLQKDFPYTSFVQPFELNDLEGFGVFPVQATSAPAYNPVTHNLVEVAPVLLGGVWTQQWEVRSKFVQYTEDGVVHTVAEQEAAALLAHQAVLVAQLQASIVEATQARLDAFAKTRNYDGILSACTYATSVIPKFQAEGQYAVNARDATWARLYEVLSEVQSNSRPMPTGFQDIEAELPALVWPA